MTYQPDQAFAGLFFAFTGGEPESIGAQLTQTMVSQSQESPLLVSTASDIAYFPGGHSKPSIESFRKSTRGFIELTAVSQWRPHRGAPAPCSGCLRDGLIGIEPLASDRRSKELHLDQGGGEAPPGG